MAVLFFFFFQAEDGIRDLTVTGVQTCALPISFRNSPARLAVELNPVDDAGRPTRRREIGRASCRERGKISVVAVSLKKKKKKTYHAGRSGWSKKSRHTAGPTGPM